MKDFTQIGNSQNENFADNEAQKTLDTVFNEWQSGKQVVEWTVLQAISAQQQASRMKILKIGLYSSAVLLVVGMLLAIKFGNMDKQTTMLFLLAIGAFLISDIFVAIPRVLKEVAKKQHNAITVKIDRNKKLAVITRQQQSQKVKYGSQGVLPAFRLPENDMGSKYATMRGQLQQQITAETGFLFEEVV